MKVFLGVTVGLPTVVRQTRLRTTSEGGGEHNPHFLEKRWSVTTYWEQARSLFPLWLEVFDKMMHSILSIARYEILAICNLVTIR